VRARRRALSLFPSVFADAGFIVVCVLIVELLLRTFVVQLYTVPSDSMENTLKVGGTVVVSRLSAEFSEPRRGEVIVFRDPGGWIKPQDPHRSRLASDATAALVFLGLIPSQTSDDLVKRVIGLPGDTVECDARGRFTVDGVPVSEPYLYPGDRSCYFPFRVTVPPGSVWVEGDHRSVSADSRYHRGVDDGAVPNGDIIGRVVAVL
jgi:signal peptidase I